MSVCESFLLGRSKKRSPGVAKKKAVPEKKGILALDKYEVREFMSIDQFVVKTPVRLPSGFCRERHNNTFHGGTIYNDAASGLIWVENQVSLGSKKTFFSRLVLSSDYGSKQLKKSPITTVIMESL